MLLAMEELELLITEELELLTMLLEDELAMLEDDVVVLEEVHDETTPPEPLWLSQVEIPIQLAPFS